MTHPDMDKSYLDKIREFYKENRRMPSHSEIGEITGLKSKGSTHKLVNKLVEQKRLEKDGAGKLIPGTTFNGLPYVGSFRAGWPTPAEEETSDTISLDEYLIARPEATSIAKVEGDSMIEAGILPGDMVLLERGLAVRNNDIVLARVDTDFTLKYYRKEKGKPFRLVGANRKYKWPIVALEQIEIIAVVRGVIRKTR